MQPARLAISDPLAHRALEALRRAESQLTRLLGSELEGDGLSATGFEVLVVLNSAGGELELRTLRRRLSMSKANATEVLDTLERHGLARRRRLARDRRAVAVELTPAGALRVQEAFPDHTLRVHRAFGVLGEEDKRRLVEICRKLAAAA